MLENDQDQGPISQVFTVLADPWGEFPHFEFSIKGFHEGVMRNFAQSAKLEIFPENSLRIPDDGNGRFHKCPIDQATWGQTDQGIPWG